MSNEKDSCCHCGLPGIACICQYKPAITSRVEFCLLTHETEYRKATNTGRLIADCLPSTRVYTWSRTEIEPALLSELASPDYQHWLVFPVDDAEQDTKAISQELLVNRSEAENEKRDVFILLDATWQQAAKMYRKSPYLSHLPILSLDPEGLSQYQLRRSSQEHHLCTVEVAVEILGLMGEKRNAERLDDYFHVFSQHYMAARSGHGVKEESEQMKRLIEEHHNEIN